MIDDPKKKGTPETDADAEQKETELSDDELDTVSGGTANTVSPALRDALQKAGRRPMG